MNLVRNATSLPETPVTKITLRKTLFGHISKVYCVDWHVGSDYKIVSCSQDGNLIIWDPVNAKLLHIIRYIDGNPVMCCCFSPSAKYIVAGSLDNVIALYKVSELHETKPAKLLTGHQGYIASVHFCPSEEKNLLSCGDTSTILWDLEVGKQVTQFKGHVGDVLSLSVNPKDESVFVTGSCDTTVKLWDIKSGKCIQTFNCHESDINTVQFFPSGQSIGSGSEDGYAKLLDLRANRELISYPVRSAITSMSFSHSGKYLIMGSFGSTIGIWDTLRAKQLQELSDHKARVSSVVVSNNGMAICSASWDNTVKIWA